MVLVRFRNDCGAACHLGGPVLVGIGERTQRHRKLDRCAVVGSDPGMSHSVPAASIVYKDDGLPGGPVSPVACSERKVIVILTNPALIDRIPSDCRRIKILQHNMATVTTNEIVARGARNSSFCFENSAI
jgi:hypothetical protein